MLARIVVAVVVAVGSTACASMRALEDALLLSCADYEEIEIGMTLDEVNMLVGFNGREVSVSRDGRVIQWSRTNTANGLDITELQATFDAEGGLYSKTQVGVCDY